MGVPPLARTDSMMSAAIWSVLTRSLGSPEVHTHLHIHIVTQVYIPHPIRSTFVYTDIEL